MNRLRMFKFRISEDELKKLQYLADNLGRSRSAIIRGLIISSYEILAKNAALPRSNKQYESQDFNPNER